MGPSPLAPVSKSVPPSDGSSPRTSQLTSLDFSVTNTSLETSDSILSDSSPMTRKNSLPSRPRNSKTDVLPCLPPPDSWPKNSSTERESLSTSPKYFLCQLIVRLTDYTYFQYTITP